MANDTRLASDMLAADPRIARRIDEALGELQDTLRDLRTHAEECSCWAKRPGEPPRLHCRGYQLLTRELDRLDEAYDMAARPVLWPEGDG